jgi:hypothetical protein
LALPTRYAKQRFTAVPGRSGGGQRVVSGPPITDLSRHLNADDHCIICQMSKSRVSLSGAHPLKFDRKLPPLLDAGWRELAFGGPDVQEIVKDRLTVLTAKAIKCALGELA